MASGPPNLVQFSQECLYFPLTQTDATIENIVQIKNLLQRTAIRGENIIAFKVLSTVRNRYGVRPSSGLILPGESTKVKFLLDIQQLRRYAAKQQQGGTAITSVMPDASTRDDMIVDVAVVPKEQAIAYLTNHKDNATASANDGNNTGDMYVEEASAFWKARGQVNQVEANAERRKLRCVHGERNVPDSLVMRMSSEKVSALVATPMTPRLGSFGPSILPPAVPTSRPQTTMTNMSNKTPPRAPPRNSPATSAMSREKISPSVNTSPSASYAPSAPTAASPLATATGGRGGRGGGAMHSNATISGVDNYAAGNAGDEEAFWKTYLFFKVPFPVLGMLIFLSFLCALLESGTILTWLLIGE
ncbi:hypothetical protein DQ04_12411000 [Trypanosoma grayi]|uniref:hypothetical protein n=1 Tax=Trypanosoma grayi TaxID=71804 RepID=UPI0004F3FF3A|nr:hypothetical protein DQ04_12411000 [Trypanosoma grayi]KEG06754.1 hypothetical protein DQ04_12411000 [Trypanosoma grayi]